MKKILAIGSALAICVAFSFAAKEATGPVNKECPISGKAVKADQTVDVGVCCGNCAKKVIKDPKLALKAKGDFKKCPISGKPAKKTVKVGFCCGNCKKKASST
ncbi:MAG: hypothetical protein CMI26_13205 [Opitutae bacterium]|nr:hypothetical protein [Opitutae bacterium]|tara:strand:+ start:1947 stop:2255 length:309 start_codon:yes stop_codon:yes gene_type:complete